ncbi:MAG: isochorismate synthase [Armatimonadetes bacterium]|nr:isochorismate synthase [Anaerolineae bacterium]
MLKSYRWKPMQPVNTPLVTSTGHLVSYSRQIAPLALLDFLHAAPANTQRIYWEHADDDLAFAGYGAAAEVFAAGDTRFETVRQALGTLFANAQIESPSAFVQPRVFGGFAFQADFAPDGIWSAFPPAYFMLPRHLLTRHGANAWLTVNACVTTEAEAAAVRAELDALITQIAGLSSAVPAAHAISEAHISYPLEHTVWRDQINTATAHMKAGELDKVVLSRSCDVTFKTPIDPLQALGRLAQRYPETYRFLVEPLPGDAFFGATPELLVALQGRALATAALAGSAKRGAIAAEDDQLGAALFQNLKERYEHQLVVGALEDMLMPLARKLNVPEAPQLLKLSNIQHLYTPITGELNADTHVLQVVQRLHPTPAMGGYPRDVAVEMLRTVEPIARGWYAAPVGWIDATGDGMFAVAIRSAVSSGSQARLYAGAGIVAGSDPDREWDETGLKFRPMLDALGVQA